MSSDNGMNNQNLDQSSQFAANLNSFMDPVNQMNLSQSTQPSHPSPINNINQFTNSSQNNNVYPTNQINHINTINSNNQMNQSNQLNQLNQINYQADQAISITSPMNNNSQVNFIPQPNQMGNQPQHQHQQFQNNPSNQPQVTGNGTETRGWNPAYVQSLLRKIQPGPGMTKQQRFQQLLKSGELTRTDVQILQRHQQMLRQAHAVRQKQLQQRAALQQQPQQQQQPTSSSNSPSILSVSGKSIPGKSIPGKSIPGKSIPGKSIPGKSISGKSIPGKSIPGKSIPGKSIPGKSIPTQNVTVNAIPDQTVTGKVLSHVNDPNLTYHNSVAGKSIPGKSLPHQNNLNNIPLNLPVNNPNPNSNTIVNAFPVNNIQSPVNQPVNQPINNPVNQPVNQSINISVNQSTNQQTKLSDAQIQQLKLEEQKKLFQQKQLQQQKYFGLTADQYEKLNPSQRQLLKLQYLRKKAKTQRFYESDEELLKKFENNPPSIDFHIHEDHYKFGNSDNLIPKSNPAIKDFLKYVARKKIPDALMEIIKDGNIQLYDGNIILRIFDHRMKSIKDNFITVKSESQSTENKGGDDSNNNTNNNNNNNNTGGLKNDNVDNKINIEETEPQLTKRYKEYRTILRLTQSALYEDFCLTTDTQMFGDSFVLTYESEILTATTRSINLQPISNPYLQDKLFWPMENMVNPKYDGENDKMIFPHRDDMREFLSFKNTKKRKFIDYENYNYKPLHQDNSQSNSKYEKLMLIMGQSLPHSNISTNKQSIEVPRFERLRFIENLRRQNQMKNDTAKGIADNQNPLNGYSGFNGFGKNDIGGQKTFGMTQNKITMDQQTKDTNIDSNTGKDTNATDSVDSKGKNSKAAGKTTAAKKKADKPKKPRKPTKKQLAAQAAAESAGNVNTGDISTLQTAQPPKKKRTPAKKKATPASTPANNQGN
jgi:hypothetical protein